MFAVGAAGENGEHSNCVKGCMWIKISGNEGMLRNFLSSSKGDIVLQGWPFGPLQTETLSAFLDSPQSAV